MSRYCLPLLLLAALPLAWAAQPGDELLVNGNLEQADASGKRPAGWSWGAGVLWANEGGNHWAVEDAPRPTSLSIGQRLALEEGYWKLRVSCRVRATDVKLGTEGWHNARLAMQFQDADRKMVGGWPNVLNFTGSTKGWETQSRDYVIPAGARWLDLSCSIFSTTGKVEWDDLSVKLLKLDPVMEDATLPAGVTACWDLQRAWKQETLSRGKVCLNGLWRFHPVALQDVGLPAGGTGWGYYKVPGSWAPGTACMTSYGPDIWEDRLDLNKTDAAWYQRAITVPAAWQGRRILLNLDNPKQTAKVLVDGREAGQIVWPGGQVDVTALVTPGQTHTLSIYVLALPLEAEQINIAREDLIEKARAEVRYKGLCGDCYLESEPMGPRVAEVFVKPSVRKHGLGLDCELAGLAASGSYRLRATVRDGEKAVWTATGAPFTGGNRASLFASWDKPRLWELDDPHLYDVKVELLNSAGKVLDVTTPVRFGFREFWIQGKDFMLNGKRIHLRCLDFFNHGQNFGLATYDRVRETFRRARSLGFNYVIHSNYDYEPQSFTYMGDVLRAGDEAGFPMSYSIRHVKRDLKDFGDAAKHAEWRRIVDYEVKQVRNHPCVFMWAMNHNFTGWAGDQNPVYMTGKYQPAPQDDPGLEARREPARLSEQYVMNLDGTRPCYHHQSGAFTQMTTLNCYLNWTPLQERQDYVSRWAAEGTKPLFFVEFGLPHQASWGNFRIGPFVWANKVSPEPMVQEFGAIYHGDAAYDLPDYARDHYDTVAKVYARKEPFGLWESLSAYWANRWEKNFLDIKSEFTQQTWPAFRTYGVPAILPWDQGDLFASPPAADAQRLELKTDWARLQRPGIAPDWVPGSSDWLTTLNPQGGKGTSLSAMFARVNADTLAYLAGPARKFTAKDHLFRSGEKLEKQLIFINDRRRAVKFSYVLTAGVGGKALPGARGTVTVAAGDKAVVPYSAVLPNVTADVAGQLALTVSRDGQRDPKLDDRFSFSVLAPTARPQAPVGTALYDPRGLTAKLLTASGVRFQAVTTPTAPEGCKLLLLGREALTADGPGVDFAGLMARGVNVVCFEQSEAVLQKRLGFRTASPGVRRVYVREPASPLCRGLSDELLRDWRGSSSLVTAYPEPQGFQGNYPTVDWCGFSNTRAWKWGNYGSVATVVIEKPARGNFAAPFDCEFDLQYTPLLEWITPQARALFCQFDLSGRDLPEPAAGRLLANLLSYAGQPLPATLGPCRYVGRQEENELLRQLGADLTGRNLAVIGPQADPAQAREAIAAAQTVVCLGLDGPALSQVLPFAVQTEAKPVLNTLVGRPTSGALVGVGNAELHWRAKTVVPVLTQLPPGFTKVATGVFAEGSFQGKRYVLQQFAPTTFDYKDQAQLTRTWRRSLTMLSRVLTNCGVELYAPVAQRLSAPPPVGLDLAGSWRFQTDPEQKLRGEEVAAPSFEDSAWRELIVPGTWEGQLPDLAKYDGVAWLRNTFDVPAEALSEPLTVTLGAVDDEDMTYLNGRLLGHIGKDTNPTNYWEALRRYPVPPGLLRPGRNVLAVRVLDTFQSGGIAKKPVGVFAVSPRWMNSFYLDAPDTLDDPYRYNRW